MKAECYAGSEEQPFSALPEIIYKLHLVNLY
jgi:hypothetical protein